MVKAITVGAVLYVLACLIIYWAGENAYFGALLGGIMAFVSVMAMGEGRGWLARFGYAAISQTIGAILTTAVMLALSGVGPGEVSIYVAVLIVSSVVVDVFCVPIIYIIHRATSFAKGMPPE